MELDISSPISQPCLMNAPLAPCGRIANNGIIIRCYFVINGKMERKVKIGMKDVTDGSSNTILMAESAFGPRDDDPDVRPWVVGSTGNCLYTVRNIAYQINQGAKPGPPRNDVGIGSEHSNGTHVAFADGSVRFLNDSIELRTLFAMSFGAGDETLPAMRRTKATPYAAPSAFSSQIA